DGHPGVHRVRVEGSPGIEINTHVGTSGIDHNQGGVIATAARAVNVIDAGFAPPSVRHITDRAGLTWGVVQYHFGDLDGLLMAVVDKGFGELLDALEKLPPPAVREGSVRARTKFVIDTIWDAFSSPTSMAALEILIS